jgi:hypothetical protein
MLVAIGALGKTHRDRGKITGYDKTRLQMEDIVPYPLALGEHLEIVGKPIRGDSEAADIVDSRVDRRGLH